MVNRWYWQPDSRHYSDCHRALNLVYQNAFEREVNTLCLGNNGNAFKSNPEIYLALFQGKEAPLEYDREIWEWAAEGQNAEVANKVEWVQKIHQKYQQGLKEGRKSLNKEEEALYSVCEKNNTDYVSCRNYLNLFTQTYDQSNKYNSSF